MRIAALLRAQTPAALGAIQRRMDDSVRNYAEGDGFALPYVAYVISARK